MYEYPYHVVNITTVSGTRNVLIAGVGRGAGRLFVFQELVQSLQQRQSHLLKQTPALHSRPVSTALDQTIFPIPKVSTQHCLDKQEEGCSSENQDVTILQYNKYF